MSTSGFRSIAGLLQATGKAENGQQGMAGVFSLVPEVGDPLAIHKFKQIAGPSPSFNTYCDIDRLLQTLTHAVAGLLKNGKRRTWNIALADKHGNCCGGAFNDRPDIATTSALEGDLRAVFGGVIMTNYEITDTIATILLRHRTNGVRRLLSAVIAPSFTPEAIATLRGTSDKIALLQNDALATLNDASLDTAMRFRYVRGGFLEQPNYTFVPHLLGAKCMGPLPDESVLDDVAFAWAIGSTSNSNTITLVRNGRLIGNGVGQQDRVGAAELAIKRALDAEKMLEPDERKRIGVRGAVAYSDSFFPFKDGPLKLIEAFVRTIFATSGSIRDAEVAEVCVAKATTLLLLPDRDARGFYAH